MIKFTKRLQKKWRNQDGESNSAYIRAQVAMAVGQVVDDSQSLRQVLKQRVKQLDTAQNISLFKEICFGTVRWYYRLEAILNYSLNKPLKPKNHDIKYLICSGLYQILEMDIVKHAAIDETVEATRLLNKPWATGLVNRTLRHFLRNKKKILSEIKKNDSHWYAYPDWLLQEIKEDWPDHWQQIIEGSNQKPPLSLRINQQKTSALGYASLLKEQSIPCQLKENYPNAVIIKNPMPAQALPGFDHGLFSVQDLAGQHVANILDLKEGQTILDACSAPGSKTCHILETEPKINKVVAIDIDAERLLRVKENMIRLDLPQECLKMVLEDASHTKQWWDGTEFDRILLDAPCSATGVIRRHPDIKLLRRSTDINTQSQIQMMLLKSLWSLLANDGKLLYTTCSVLKQENEKVIQQFLRENKTAHLKKLNIPNAMQTKYGSQLFPTENDSDGFFFALLTKK